jgi:glycosyltransferase involved in cell wall biosynthesis
MSHREALLCVGPAQGGVGDAFAGTLKALGDSGRTVVGEQLPDRESPWRVAREAAKRHWRLLKQADTVHVEFGSNDIAAFWFAVIATLTRRDAVVVVHDPHIVAHAPGAGLIAKRKRWRSTFAYRVLSPLIDRAAVATVLRRAGTIVVLGPSAVASLSTRTTRPVVSVPLAAEPNRTVRQVPSDCRYFLFAGYLGPHKGIESLIDAWGKIGCTDLRLVIVGGVGPGNLDWAEAVRARGSVLASPPEWIGHVKSEADFQGWIEAAAAVVLPYERSSPASGILVRAMLAGRCVIATRVEAVTDAVEDGVSGWVVDVGDTDGLAARLMDAAEDGAKRDRLGAAAQSSAERIFGWDRFLSGIAEAYALANSATTRAR